jgi:helix-turn-helix protein
MRGRFRNFPTYCALSDYANNKTGLASPKMETRANTLGHSVRTIQKHLHLLKEKGLIEFVERRRHKGMFSSYLYRVVHIVSSSNSITGHGRRAVYFGCVSSLVTLCKRHFSDSLLPRTPHSNKLPIIYQSPLEAHLSFAVGQ